VRISSMDLFLRRERESATGSDGAGGPPDAGAGFDEVGAVAPNRLVGGADVFAAVVPPKRLLAVPVDAEAAVEAAGAEDAATALEAAGVDPSPPNKLPGGAALDAGGFAPNNDGVAVDVAAGAGVAVDADGAFKVKDGVEPAVVAAGVLPAPPNNEGVPAFGCSAGLLKPKRLPDEAGCEEAAGAVGAVCAGVVDCDAAGVLAPGWANRLLPVGGCAGF
jgi:hypothetical protein